MSSKRSVDYKWVMAGLCAMMLFFALGFCSSNRGLYLTAVTEALGIKRSAFSLSDSIRYVGMAVVNFYFGRLIVRFGARKLLAAGFCSLVVACVLQALAPNIWFFYLAGCFLGIGFSFTSTTMASWILRRWFKEHIGTVLGAVLATNGLGGALASQIITPILYGADSFGYRKAFWMVAALLAMTGLLIVVFYRDPPEQEEAAVPRKPAAKTEKIPLDLRMIITMVCVFLTGLILQGTGGIAAAHMMDQGLNSGYVGKVLGISSLLLAGSKFLIGFVFDRRGLRFTVSLCTGAASVTMIILAAMNGSVWDRWLALAYTVVHAVAIPLETVMLPLITTGLSKGESNANLLGKIVSVNVAGYAVGGPLLNKSYELLGSYVPLLFGAAGVMLVIVMVYQFIFKRRAE